MHLFYCWFVIFILCASYALFAYIHSFRCCDVCVFFVFFIHMWLVIIRCHSVQSQRTHPLTPILIMITYIFECNYIESLLWLGIASLINANQITHWPFDMRATNIFFFRCLSLTKFTMLLTLAASFSIIQSKCGFWMLLDLADLNKGQNTGYHSPINKNDEKYVAGINIIYTCRRWTMDNKIECIVKVVKTYSVPFWL